MTVVSIILVDKRIKDYDTIFKALKPDDVTSILFDVFEIDTAICQDTRITSFQYILNKIAEIGVGSITNVGIVQHNTGAPFHRFFSQSQGEESIVASVEAEDPTLQSWAEFTGFITSLKNTYGVQNVDLMACALYSNPNWKYVIDTLAIQTGVTIRASTDDTGAAALGGDWFLESHTGVNLKDVYFTDTIENFNGVLLFFTKYDSSRLVTPKSMAVGKATAWGATGYGGGTNINTVTGDIITSGVVALYSNGNAFAALKTNGSVSTWGDNSTGGNQTRGGTSPSIASSLTSGVVEIFSTRYAFAALKNDGTVVTWGYSSGYGSVSPTGLSDVVNIFSGLYIFAALRSNGSLVTWGSAPHGGDSTAVASSLSSGVVFVNMLDGGQIVSPAVAALKNDGSLVTWPTTSTSGGNSSSVASSISSGVVVLYTDNFTFAALKNNGSVIYWGATGYGGNSYVAAPTLTNIVTISGIKAYAALTTSGSVLTWGLISNGGYSSGKSLSSNVVKVYNNTWAFAALKFDGSVVTWGDSTYGGNSSSVTSDLTSGVVALYGNNYAFAALKSNGKVITWGYSTLGGSSASVATDISAGVVGIYVTQNAFAALRNDGKLITWGGSVDGGSSTSVSTDLSAGVVSVNNTYLAFAAITSSATTFDLSMSYYRDIDRYNILRNKENRRRANLTTLNNNVFTLSNARDIERFNYTIPNDTGPFRIIVPDYVVSNYSITSTVTVPGGASINYIIACEEGEPIIISGLTYINYGAFVYLRNANNTFTKITTTTIGSITYHLYGGDGINSSGIALRYRIGPFTIPTKTFGDTSFNITEPISYGSGAFTYTSNNTTIATVTSSGTVTITGPGTTTITATRPGGSASDITGITNSSVIKATSATTSRNWRSISLSNNGQYQTAVTRTSGYIYTSSNYGITWTERTTAGARDWNSISLSSTGEYQTAVVPSGYIYTSSDYGVTWTERSVVNTWLSVSISNTGQYQTAVGSVSNIWTSSNYGVTWTEVTPPGITNWRSVSLSGTGQYQTAVAQTIYTSSNYGATWTQRTSGSNQWESVSISETGLYQTAVIYGGGVYTSSDYGASWTLRTTVNRNWYSISLSNTGQYQTALHYQGNIWISSNYGITWTERTTAGARNWNSISLSETGEFQSAVISGGQIYFSTNYGFTWSNIASYELMSVTTTFVVNKGAFTLGALTVPTKEPGDVPFTLTTPTSSVSTIISPTYTITNTASVIIPPPSSSINSLTYGAGWYQEGGNFIGDSTGELCGYSTSMSADGTIIAVGYISATQPSSGISSSGRVRVFKSDINKTTSNALGPAGWNQLGGDIYGEAASDRGGWRVTLSADGTVVAISADMNDGTSGTVNTNDERGHVRVYRYTPTKTSAIATQTDPSFGPVGWTRMGADIDGQSAGDYFGTSLSISADGNIIAVGAPANKGPSGTTAAIGQVRIFRYTPNKPAVTNVNDLSFGPAGWTRIGSDIYGDIAGEQEGRGIALSADGNSFVTGAIGALVSRGRIRTYVWNGTQWNKRGSDITGINAFDLFGNSVAISANGNIIAGAARQADGNSITNNGSVRIYYWNTITNDWTQQGADIYGEAHSDDSGWSISLSSDGTIIAIGAYRNDGTSGTVDTGDNRGHVRIYKYDVNKSQAQMNQGLANFGPIGWNRLNSDIDGSAASNNFGQSVSLSSEGTKIIVGEPYYAEGGVTRGRARVFYISTTNAITYTSSNSNVADVCGNLLLIKGVNGTSTITASQTGNIVTGRLDVIGTSYTLQYNPITYTSSNTSVATVSAYGTITLTGTIGTSTITAIQPETLLYVSQSVTETLNVSGTVTVLSQFNIPEKMLGDPPFNISQPSSNNPGGTFTYTSSNASVATVTLDGVVTVNGIGTTTITAFQSTSGIYSTASISSSLIVNFGNTNTITRLPTDGAYVIPTPISDVSTIYGSLWNKLGADIVGKVVGDEHGTSVSISADGTIVAIGSRSNTTNRGTVRVYKFNDVSWVQIGTDINGETSSDYSGQSVSISANGRVVAIGANMNDGSGNLLPDSGHVRIYEYNGTNWVQRGGDIDGEANGDQSGISVSLSEEGNIIAIGAIMNDGSGNLLSNSGHVRVYKYNSLKSAAQLTNQNLSTFGPAGWDRLGADIDGEAINDQSGFSVSLSANGTIVAIGAIFNDGTSGTVDTSNNRGHVRVYRYNSIKTEPQLTNQNLSTFGPAGWDRLGADIDGEAAADQSGFSVSLAADGNTVAIGSPYHDPSGVSNAGRVRVFAWNGSSWAQRGQNINGVMLNENMGDSVSLSADGNIISVASFMKVVNYNYNSSTNTWSQIGANITGAALSETNIVNATSYSPHVYLDATNPNSYNGSMWTNIGSLGGNVVMTNMGTFDAADNGGSFNFNGNNYGQLNITSTTLTSVTYVAVVKTTGLNTGWASIIDFGNDNILLSTLGNVLYLYNPSQSSYFTLTAGVWYVVAMTITTGGAVTFYVNGVSIFTGSVIALSGRTNNGWGIGSGITGSEPWNGKISALAIYHNRVLTASEIANLSSTYQTYKVNLSSQGNILAIGAREYDGVTGTTTNIGVTRVYRIDTSGNYTFSINNNAIADICGNIILPKSVGSTTVAFTQSASSGRASRSGTIPLIISGITPTFGTFTVPAKNFGDASFNLTAPTSDSSGAFTYVSNNNAVATVTPGGTVTIVGVGTTTITVTQAASEDGNYISRDISGALVVSASLSNFTVPAKIYGDASFNLTDPDSTDNTVGFTFTSNNTNVATLNGRIVTIVGVGSTVITATQEATANRGQLDISATLVVSPRRPVITLDPIVKLYGNSSFRPQPSTTNTDISGGRVFTFTSDNIAVVSMLDASLVRINGVGSTTLRYTQAASSNFTDASGTVSITVNKGISGFSASTFAVAANKTYGDSSFAITTVPIGSSTGAITYSSNNESVATIDNNGIITLVGQGTVTFTASQVESALYAADTKTSNTLTVARKTVALSRNTPTTATITKYYGDASFSIIATNESNGEIVYTSADPSFATIDPSSGRVNIIALGSTTLTATRGQTAQYNETDVSWSLTINRGQTTLTGLEPMTRNVTVTPFSVTATSASDGAITYAVQDPVSTVLTIHPTSGLVTLLSPGLATIVASQAQGTLYEAPPNITATITVTAASNTLEGATLTNTNNFTNVDLSGASLANTTITNTNFTSGRLNNTNFNGSNISNANMSLSELSNASLTNTTITNTTFVSGRLNNANLNGSTITGSNMTSTDLSGARLTNATINGTNFTSAILTRTDLSGSSIRNSILNSVNLSGSTLTRIDASGSSFVNANLSNANLSNADFTNANMTNANINDANLTNVSFTVPQKLQLLKNTNNRLRSEIQVSEVFGNVLLSLLSEGSTVRDVPNVSNARFKIMVPTTSFDANDTIPNIVLDISNYGYFYFPIGENEYFQIENIKYYVIGSTIRNYLTGAVVENLTYGVKAIRLIAGSLTVVVNSINTLSSTSFVVPSYKLNTDMPFSPTTLPTSNSSSPIVYMSSNTGIATIDPSSGIITPIAGACGFVTFTASQVATETHESSTITSNELFVNRLIDLALSGLDQTFTLSEYAALDTAAISPENTDATAVMYVRLSDMRELFQYHTDSNDINDISASDIKYYVFHRKFPNEIKINPSHAMMNKTESYGMYGNFQDFTQDKSLVKHDFVRYIALRLFNTFHGVDLFQNETDLHENITYLGETVQHNINLILSEISTTSSSGTMAIDVSGNKYLTNYASGNTNLCRELMRQIAASNPSRLYDNNQNYSGIKPVPLLEDDSINFKVSITPAPGQNALTDVSVIPPRTYMIKLVLKNTVNTVTNTNTKVTDSEMYPNSYPYSSSVVTYAPTIDSSNVYNVYSPPAPIPYARFGYNGWYYTNTTEWVNVAPLVRERIKWTVAANTASSTVADLQYIRMTIKLYNKTSVPFIVVYTSSGSYRKYTISTPNALVNGTVYSFYINFNSYTREPAIVGTTNAELTYSGVSSGSFGANEGISSITIETDNTAATSSIEFTLSSIIIGDTSGEKEHGFSAIVPESYP